MNRSIQFSVSIATAAAMAGCAHLPDATVNYYLAQTKVSFKVVRTVACDAQDEVIVSNAATPSATHSADRSTGFPLKLAGLKGTFSDTDTKFDFYDDGRLKGVNATSTGQGEAILKTVVSIASAIFAFDGGPPRFPNECAAIRKVDGGKALTLTYQGEIDLKKGVGELQSIPPDTTSGVYATRFASAIGTVCAAIVATERPTVPVSSTPATGVLLHARQPGLVRIRVTAGTGGPLGCEGREIWLDEVPAAQLGVPYDLPIPAPATFGKQVFAASFAESGALASLQYASNTGAGQVLNVLNSALTASQGKRRRRRRRMSKRRPISSRSSSVSCSVWPTRRRASEIAGALSLAQRRDFRIVTSRSAPGRLRRGRGDGDPGRAIHERLSVRGLVR